MPPPKFDESKPFEPGPAEGRALRAPQFNPALPFDAEPKFNPALPLDTDKPDSHGALSAAVRGLNHGLSLGYEDELTGGATAGLQALANLLPTSIARHVDIAQAPADDAYRYSRDEERSADASAQGAHPLAYGLSELGGSLATAFLPGLNAARGAGALSMVGRGAMAGGLAGLGASGADLTRGQVGKAAIDTGVGATLGGAAGVLGARLGAFANKAATEARMALADAAQASAQKAQRAVDSSRGALGGEVASVLDAAKSFEHALTSPLSTAAQKAEATERLGSPEFQALYQNALSNKLGLTADKMSGRLLNARSAYETAVAQNTPLAIEAAADDSVSNPIRRQILPRLGTYAERAIPPLVGMHFGGLPGAAAGGLMAVTMGKPGTAMANMARNPGVRNLVWSALAPAGDALSSAAALAAAPEGLELAPDVAAMVAALRKSGAPDAPRAGMEL